MNKMLLMLLCITAYSFSCAMESNHITKISACNSSDSLFQPVSRGRRLTESDIVSDKAKLQDSPLYNRVRSQSRENDLFVNQENARKIFGKDRNENS